MIKMIKVKCTPNGHVHEIDVVKLLLTGTTIYRNLPEQQPQIRERYVLKCRQCTNGKVIITRKMIEEMLND